MTSQYERELIQVAAVAVAAVEVFRHGRAQTGLNTHLILSEIFAERLRQDQIWGFQQHTVSDWMRILGEEFGSLCKASFEVSPQRWSRYDE